MAAKIKPICNECDKELSSKQSLKNHMQSVHDGLKGLKGLFSSPKPLQQKKLFNTIEKATHGSSTDPVTNAQITSEGDFLCADCDEKFTSNELAMNHICNIHDKTDVAEETDVVENTETNDDMLNSERGPPLA